MRYHADKATMSKLKLELLFLLYQPEHCDGLRVVVEFHRNVSIFRHMSLKPKTSEVVKRLLEVNVKNKTLVLRFNKKNIIKFYSLHLYCNKQAVYTNLVLYK